MIAEKENELRTKEALLAQLTASLNALTGKQTGTNSGNPFGNVAPEQSRQDKKTGLETNQHSKGETSQTASNPVVAGLAPAQTPVTYSRAAKHNLPKTGDTSSIITLLAGSMIASLGIVGFKKRRR